MATFKVGDMAYRARIWGINREEVEIHSAEVRQVRADGQLRLSAREGAWGFRKEVASAQMSATPGAALTVLEAELNDSIAALRSRIRSEEANAEKVREAFRALTAEAPKP